jgi:hypothetical protein
VSRSFRAGLIVLGVLSTADLLLPLFTDGEHPPMAVALVGSLIGLASLALIVSAWRGAKRAVIPLVVLRLVSALTAVPAFFEPGVPSAAIAAAAIAAAAIAAAATGVTLTVLGVALVLPVPRRSSVVGAR